MSALYRALTDLADARKERNEACAPAPGTLADAWGAVTVGIKIKAANTMLDQIDPAIRQALYKAVEGQEQLEGVEPTTPVLRCNSFDSIALTTAHEGWTLLVDDSIDESDPMKFGAVKVDKMKVDAEQGGSVVLSFRCGTSDVDAERLGALGMHNGQDIWIQLLPPKKGAPAIDGTTAAFQADHPDADATDLFAAGEDHEGEAEQLDGEARVDSFDEDEDEGAAPDLETRLDAALSAEDAADAARVAEGWPFPSANGGSAVSDEERSRLAAAEQAELEAGLGKAIAAAGVKPARGKSKSARGKSKSAH